MGYKHTHTWGPCAADSMPGGVEREPASHMQVSSMAPSSSTGRVCWDSRELGSSNDALPHTEGAGWRERELTLTFWFLLFL